MDEQHLIATARYIELNPVKAGIVSQAATGMNDVSTNVKDSAGAAREISTNSC